MESAPFARASKALAAAPLPAQAPRANFPFRHLQHVRVGGGRRRGSLFSVVAVAITPQTETATASASASAAPLMKVSADSLQYESGRLGGISERTRPSAAEGGGGDGVPSSMAYLTNIINSRVYDVAIESPLQKATKLSERLGVKLWLKREDLQPGKNRTSHHYMKAIS